MPFRSTWFVAAFVTWDQMAGHFWKPFLPPLPPPPTHLPPAYIQWLICGFKFRPGKRFVQQSGVFGTSKAGEEDGWLTWHSSLATVFGWVQFSLPSSEINSLSSSSQPISTAIQNNCRFVFAVRIKRLAALRFLLRASEANDGNGMMGCHGAWDGIGWW